MPFLGPPSVPSAANTTNLVCLNEIGQGTDFYQRLGSQVTVTSIFIRGCVKTPVAKLGDNTYNNCVTVYVIQDRQANGNVPAVTDFLSVSGLTDPSTTMRNLGNRSRFKVLAKRQMILIGGTNANTYYFEISVKKPIKTTYDGSTASYSNIKTNSIWLALCDNLSWSATDPDTTHAYVESLYTRTRFVDP